ncbi:MAG: hypothetical protein GY835_14230 [bacterium]|nr:hypothetical protein [bacterium]
MLFNSHSRPIRLSLATLVLLIVGIGACQLPTQYSTEIGQQINFSLAANNNSVETIKNLFGQIGKIVSFLETMPGVDDVSININQPSDDGVAGIDVVAWGSGLSADDLANSLQSEFPVLAQADVRGQGVGGTVKGTVKDRLLHDCLKLQINTSSLEDMRVDIEKQLEEQGFVGEVSVSSVHDAITITMEYVSISAEEGDTNLSVMVYMTEDSLGQDLEQMMKEGTLDIEEGETICIEYISSGDDN